MITRSETIGKLALALSKAQAQMGHACKDKDNPFFKSKYADFTAVIDVAKPHLAANELAIAQLTEVSEAGDTYLITLLMHSSGEHMQSRIKLSIGKNDQATGSSITYMKRYSYAAILGIATMEDESDDDGDAQRREAEEERRKKQHLKDQPQNKPPFAPPAKPGSSPVIKPKSEASTESEQKDDPNIFMTTERWKPMYATMNAKGVTKEDLKKYIFETFKMDSTKQFTEREYNATMLWLRAKPIKAAQAQSSEAPKAPENKSGKFAEFDPYDLPHVLK